MTNFISVWVPLISICLSLFAFTQTIIMLWKRKTNLVISIHEVIPDITDELVFFYLVFSNESTQAISITDLSLDYSPEFIPSNKRGDTGGKAMFISVPVFFDLSPGGKSVNRDLNVDSTALPITIPGETCKGGYFAFIAGSNSSHAMQYKVPIVTITTPRGISKVKMDVSLTNTEDRTYRVKKFHNHSHSRFTTYLRKSKRQLLKRLPRRK